MDFEKPAKSYEEQINILIERGLIVDNPEFAIKALAHINYYRLSAYMLPFKPYKNSEDELLREMFETNTEFNTIGGF
jgi:abortive infection bacteriophage resistance protein